MELSTSQKNDFQQNGFLILNDFVSDESCLQLINRMQNLIDHFDPLEVKTIFSTKDNRHAKNLYFLESGDKIRFFFEEGAVNEQGELKYDKSLCINKVGHALHTLDPVFRDFSYAPALAQVITEMGITRPRLAQSMYICKQPYIGGEVTCHQDSTYLYVKDQPVMGFWFALEEATIENGCLWAIPGGHQSPLKSRMLRDKDNQISFASYDESPWQLDQMIPLEVARGSMIILHGL